MLELHTDNAAKDLTKRFTVHVVGCKHRRPAMSPVYVDRITGMDDPTVVELKSIGWKVTLAPCTKKGN